MAYSGGQRTVMKFAQTSIGRFHFNSAYVTLSWEVKHMEG
jgi:hypothetical protein